MIIADDFLDDPEQFRAHALRLTYDQPGPYPGRNSRQRTELEGLDQAVSAIVNEPLQPLHSAESHGKFRLTLATDDQPGKVHVDPSHWSGILYLSRPEDCRGGTEFYRHPQNYTGNPAGRAFGAEICFARRTTGTIEDQISAEITAAVTRDGIAAGYEHAWELREIYSRNGDVVITE